MDREQFSLHVYFSTLSPLALTMEFENTYFTLDEVDSVLDDLVFVTRSTPFQFDTLPVLVDVASGGTATRGNLIIDHLSSTVERSCSTIYTLIVKPRLSEPRLPRFGFHLQFCLIRTACVKIQTSGCSVLLFLVLLAGVMASIKHKKVVRTISSS